MTESIKTFEELETYARRIGWQVISDTSDFENHHSNLYFICPLKHKISLTVTHFINRAKPSSQFKNNCRGKGCSRCSGIYPIQEKFDELFDKTTFKLSSKLPTSTKYKATIACRVCNTEFTAKAGNLLKYKGCRVCDKRNKNYSDFNHFSDFLGAKPDLEGRDEVPPNYKVLWTDQNGKKFNLSYFQVMELYRTKLH
jgi:hypothetical protein